METKPGDIDDCTEGDSPVMIALEIDVHAVLYLLRRFLFVVGDRYWRLSATLEVVYKHCPSIILLGFTLGNYVIFIDH
jgi:hypothetical protein